MELWKLQRPCTRHWPSRVQYGVYLRADNEEGPFELPASQQGGGWVTDQQALEAKRDPNQPNDLYPQFAAGLREDGPGENNLFKDLHS